MRTQDQNIRQWKEEYRQQEKAQLNRAWGEVGRALNATASQTQHGPHRKTKSGHRSGLLFWLILLGLLWYGGHLAGFIR